MRVHVEIGEHHKNEDLCNDMMSFNGNIPKVTQHRFILLGAEIK